MVDALDWAFAAVLGYRIELLEADAAGVRPLEAAVPVERGAAERAIDESGWMLDAWLGYLIELFDDDTTGPRVLERSLADERGAAERTLAELCD